MRTKITILIGLLALIAAACSGSGDGVTVEDAWGRPSPSATENAAFYMTLVGGAETDSLTTASSDACSMTELHETSMNDGQMSMAPVEDGIEVPADSTVMLEPGGLHVMCMGVVEPLEAGDSVDVQLGFASGETVTVSADIRDE